LKLAETVAAGNGRSRKRREKGRRKARIRQVVRRERTPKRKRRNE